MLEHGSRDVHHPGLADLLKLGGQLFICGLC